MSTILYDPARGMEYVEDGSGHRRYLCAYKTSNPASVGLRRFADFRMVVPRSAWVEFSLRPLGTTRWDQNGHGSCVGHGSGKAFMYAWLASGQTRQEFSPTFLYGLINGGMDQGAIVGDALIALQQKGIALMSQVPESMVFQRQFPQEAFDTAKRFKIDPSQSFNCPSFDEIASAILTGCPVSFGVEIGQAFNPDSNGIIPDQRGGGGGHCMCAMGLKNIGGRWYLEVENSWGRQWGECLVGSTKIPLLSGQEKTLEELVEEGSEFWVYSYDVGRKKIVPALARAKKTGYRGDLLTIMLDNGEKVICTEDHLWMIRDGSYREAKKLSVGDSLMPLYRSFRKGYERVLQQKNGIWAVTHWLVVNELRIRRNLKTEHVCDDAKCPIVVHHKDFNSRNNDPNNLECLFACEHRKYHEQTARENAKKMNAVWDDPEKRIAKLEEAIRHIQTYNEKFRNGEVKMTDKQLEARRENMVIARTAAAEKLAVEGCTEAQIEARRKSAYRMGTRPRTPEWRRKLSEAAKRQHRNNHKVVSVEGYNVAQAVYDLSVPEYHNFALSAGVFVHNSGFCWMPESYFQGGDNWSLRAALDDPTDPNNPPVVKE